MSRYPFPVSFFLLCNQLNGAGEGVRVPRWLSDSKSAATFSTVPLIFILCPSFLGKFERRIDPSITFVGPCSFGRRQFIQLVGQKGQGAGQRFLLRGHSGGRRISSDVRDICFFVPSLPFFCSLAWQMIDRFSG